MHDPRFIGNKDFFRVITFLQINQNVTVGTPQDAPLKSYIRGVTTGSVKKSEAVCESLYCSNAARLSDLESHDKGICMCSDMCLSSTELACQCWHQRCHRVVSVMDFSPEGTLFWWQTKERQQQSCQ